MSIVWLSEVIKWKPLMPHQGFRQKNYKTPPWLIRIIPNKLKNNQTCQLQMGQLVRFKNGAIFQKFPSMITTYIKLVKIGEIFSLFLNLSPDFRWGNCFNVTLNKWHLVGLKTTLCLIPNIGQLPYHHTTLNKIPPCLLANHCLLWPMSLGKLVPLTQIQCFSFAGLGLSCEFDPHLDM